MDNIEVITNKNNLYFFVIVFWAKLKKRIIWKTLTSIITLHQFIFTGQTFIEKEKVQVFGILTCNQKEKELYKRAK